jgi:hypothetical protein
MAPDLPLTPRAAMPAAEPGACEDRLLAVMLTTIWATRTGRTLRPVPVSELSAEELVDFWADDQIMKEPERLGIFISYRRADAGPYARLLQVELTERFPGARVFIDPDSIEAGLDVAKVIRDAVNSCRVMVVLIGRQWVTLADEEGRRRLDDPDDYVRFEVGAALKRGVRAIPVLVDGARPLRPQQLPPDLRELARLNALEMSYDRYRYDADRLASLIGRVLGDALSGCRVGAFGVGLVH